MNITIKEYEYLADENTEKILNIANESEYISLNYDNIKHYVESKYNKIFLAFTDENIVLAFIIFSHIDREIDIIDLAVKRSYRNKGIGNSIINFLLQYSKNNNIKKITLDVNEKNVIAFNFYVKHSFKVDAIREKYYDNRYSSLIMSLIL